MRLNEKTKNLIIDYSKECFSDFNIYLFGSRVDDSKKGGDIDLFVDSKVNIPLENQMLFLKKLYKNVTQRKIDLVVKSPSQEDKEIFKTALENGIRLY